MGRGSQKGPGQDTSPGLQVQEVEYKGRGWSPGEGWSGPLRLGFGVCVRLSSSASGWAWAE